MNDEDADDESFEARLRWFAQQVSRSVEDLGELDLNLIARMVGVDVDRAKQLLDGAGQWLDGQASDAVSDALLRFGEIFGATGHGPSAPGGAGPHPLDLPTAEQGLALSAIDSGRWTVEPGSHLLQAHGEGPAPADAVGLVGELRARDWITATGEVTVVGRNALRRWAEGSGTG